MSNDIFFSGKPIPFELQDVSYIQERYDYITRPFSLEREIELSILKYKKLKEKGLSDDVIINENLNVWAMDAQEYIRNQRLPSFFYYVGAIWSELSTVSWKTEDILKIDNIDVERGSATKGTFIVDERFSPIIKDMTNFLASGSHINMDKGMTLEQFWFLKTYAYKLPFLSFVNKNFRDRVSSKRIEYKYFSDSLGIVNFLHHLMLWENEDYPDFLEGAPFKNCIQDFYCKYIQPDIYYSIFPCLVFDKEKRIGHAIEIVYWNRMSRKFVYNDRWPIESLLNKFNGINVSVCNQVGYLGEDLWEISPHDLAHCIFSVLVPFRITSMDFLYYGTDTKYILIPFAKED